MKKRYKFGALLLSAVLAMSLTACGGSASSTPVSSSSPATSAPAPSSDAASTAEVDWPKKDISVIVPFNPGGDTDFNARCYIEGVSKELGVNVNVVNVNGNGGAVGAMQAKQAANDGYTVLFSSSAFLTAQLAETIDFTLDDMTFSCLVGQGPGNCIMISKAFSDANGITDLATLKAYCDANPGVLNCAADTGATTQICALMLKNKGFDLNVVDTGNSAERITAMLGGNVDIIINSYGSIKSYIESGDFVCLGICTDQQPTHIPDVQTCVAQGFDIVFPSFFFFAFPGGTDEAIAEKWAAACEKVAATQEYADMVRDAYAQDVVFDAGAAGKDKLSEAYQQIASLKAEFQ